MSSEATLVRKAYERLARLPGLSVRREVPIMGRSADLAYVLARKDLVITVEFKLRDWRRGLLQAEDHLLAADLAYVCMPRRSVTATMLDAFKESGVGLLFYCETGRWPFETIFEPSGSAWTWRKARTGLLKYFSAA